MKSANKIYLHVGVGKTGTTTIQHGLRDNYQELADLGYLYPRSGRYTDIENNSVHHNLAFEIGEDPRYNPRGGNFRNLIKEIKKSSLERIILSSECFLPHHASKLLNILTPLGEVFIVYYVRRQDKWLASLWAQRMKEPGYMLSFEEAMQEFFLNIGYYSRGVGAWAKVFGKENIRVRVFERGQLYNGDLFVDFLHTCDIEKFDRFDIPGPANPSASIKVLELTRIIRTSLNESNVPSIENQSGKNIFYLVSEYADANRWGRERPVLTNKKQYEEIRTIYSETNQKLASEYLNRSEVFYEPYIKKPITSFKINEFSSTEMLDLLVYIFSRLLSS